MLIFLEQNIPNLVSFFCCRNVFQHERKLSIHGVIDGLPELRSSMVYLQGLEAALVSANLWLALKAAAERPLARWVLMLSACWHLTFRNRENTNANSKITIFKFWDAGDGFLLFLALTNVVHKDLSNYYSVAIRSSWVEFDSAASECPFFIFGPSFSSSRSIFISCGNIT